MYVARGRCAAQPPRRQQASSVASLRGGAAAARCAGRCCAARTREASASDSGNYARMKTVPIVAPTAAAATVPVHSRRRQAMQASAGAVTTVATQATFRNDSTFRPQSFASRLLLRRCRRPGLIPHHCEAHQHQKTAAYAPPVTATASTTASDEADRFSRSWVRPAPPRSSDTDPRLWPMSSTLLVAAAAAPAPFPAIPAERRAAAELLGVSLLADGDEVRAAWARQQTARRRASATLRQPQPQPQPPPTAGSRSIWVDEGGSRSGGQYEAARRLNGAYRLLAAAGRCNLNNTPWRRQHGMTIGEDAASVVAAGSSSQPPPHAATTSAPRAPGRWRWGAGGTLLPPRRPRCRRGLPLGMRRAHTARTDGFCYHSWQYVNFHP